MSTARQEMIERYKQEFKEKINNFWRRGQAAERKLSTIQMFTNSYSSFSNSRIDFAPNPMQSPFDTMMSMLEDLYDKEVSKNSSNCSKFSIFWEIFSFYFLVQILGFDCSLGYGEQCEGLQ